MQHNGSSLGTGRPDILWGVLVAVMMFSLFVPMIPYQYRSMEPRKRIVVYTEDEVYATTNRTEWHVTWFLVTGEGRLGAQLGESTFPAVFDYDWGAGKVYGNYTDYVGFVATAEINVGGSGSVSFTAGGDEGFELYCDGKPIVQSWQPGLYRTSTALVTLSSGRHRLVFQYYEWVDSARVTFSTDPDVTTWDAAYEPVQKTKIVTEYVEVTKRKYVSVFQLLTLICHDQCRI